MIIEKKFVDNYARDDDLCNYCDDGELTVTITLGEYRALVAAKVRSELQQEKLDWLKQYQRANEAEARVRDLEARLAKMAERMTDTATEPDEEE